MLRPPLDYAQSDPTTPPPPPKTPQLVDNWRAILRHAWSVRFIAAAGFFTALEHAVPLLQGVLPIPPVVFAVLTGVSMGGAFVARFVVQQQVSAGAE